MDRRRHEDSRDRRRDDYRDDYLGRSRYGREDRERNRSRSRSRSRDGNRVRRSRSPRRDYHDEDRRIYNKTSYSNSNTNNSNYRDLDRPEALKEKKDVEMKESPRKVAVSAVNPSEPDATEAEELLE